MNIKEIMNAQDATAKAIEFVNWREEIAERKINNGEDITAAIKTFKNTVDSMFFNVSRKVAIDMIQVHMASTNAIDSLLDYYDTNKAKAAESRQKPVKKTDSEYKEMTMTLLKTRFDNAMKAMSEAKTLAQMNAIFDDFVEPEFPAEIPMRIISSFATLFKNYCDIIKTQCEAQAAIDEIMY